MAKFDADATVLSLFGDSSVPWPSEPSELASLRVRVRAALHDAHSAGLREQRENVEATVDRSLSTWRESSDAFQALTELSNNLFHVLR